MIQQLNEECHRKRLHELRSNKKKTKRKKKALEQRTEFTKNRKNSIIDIANIICKQIDVCSVYGKLITLRIYIFFYFFLFYATVAFHTIVFDVLKKI